MENYFKNSRERPAADMNSVFKSLQMPLTSVQLSLYTVLDRIVRTGPASREAVLQFFADSITLNAKRTAMRVDPRVVSSDGYMVNLQAVLLQFASPFIDPHYSKVSPVSFGQGRRSYVSAD